MSVALLGDVRSFVQMVVAQRFVLCPFSLWRKEKAYNRFTIAFVHGRQRLSVPLLGGRNQKKSVGDVRISYAFEWVAYQKKAITCAYRSAPWFMYYADEFFTLHDRNHVLLWDRMVDFLHFFLRVFALPVSVEICRKCVNSASFCDHASVPFGEPVYPPYEQCFLQQTGFQQNLSVVDVLFCLGPRAGEYIDNIAKAVRTSEIVP